jgi:hypothetical protein
MESTSARDIDRRLADLVRSERHLVVQFVVELAGFAKRELYRELGYTSLFYYCVRQLGLSKSSAFRRSEVARLIARFPVIARQLAEGRLSIRALVEEYRPKPIPRDVVRALPMPPAPLGALSAVPAGTKNHPAPHEVVKPLTADLRRLNVTVSADSRPSWSKCVPRSLTSAPTGVSNRSCAKPSSSSSSEIESARH